MLGIKYRYEVLDDDHVKLAPTKGTYIATAVLTVLTVVVPPIVLKAAEIREDRRNSKPTRPSYTSPTN